MLNSMFTLCVACFYKGIIVGCCKAPPAKGSQAFMRFRGSEWLEQLAYIFLDFYQTTFTNSIATYNIKW